MEQDAALAERDRLFAAVGHGRCQRDQVAREQVELAVQVPEVGLDVAILLADCMQHMAGFVIQPTQLAQQVEHFAVGEVAVGRQPPRYTRADGALADHDRAVDAVEVALVARGAVHDGGCCIASTMRATGAV